MSSALRALTDEYLRVYPDEAAGVMNGRPLGEILALLAAEPAPLAAALLERLSPEVAAAAIEDMDDEQVRHILPAVDPARVAGLLARLDAEVRGRKLAALGPGTAAELEELMTFPADSAGFLMDARVTTFRSGTTVGEALERLRARRGEEFDELLLLDPEARLVGRVHIVNIAVSPPEERLDELARPPVAVQGTMPREDVVEMLMQSRLGTLPVVDFEGRLLGVIRHDELLAATEREASVDIQTMVGASKEERALSRVGFAVRKRLPWLEVNLLTAFLAAAVVGLFEGTIARITALAVLMPVVAGQSGNSGAQALAVTMRGLALREVRPRHWPRLALKELRVGLLNGVALALTTAAAVLAWSRSPGLSLVIGVAMVISMSVAGLAGASVPIALKVLGQDPAQSSSIILTTVTDVVGFLSFLGLATVLARFV